MLAMIAYDISSNRKRGRLHRLLKEFGLNTQKSVFECDIDEAGLSRLVANVKELVDPETDSFRIYRLCAGCQRKVAVSGQGIKLVSLDFLVI